MTEQSAILEALDREVRRRKPLWRRLQPAQLFVTGFGCMILAGTALLLWMPGIYAGERLSLVDALFTATSAVCVTGLIVVDTATYFTPVGQALIAGLIQVGGLGILSFTTLIILMLGRRVSLRSEEAVGPAEIVPDIDPVDLVRAIFRYTFTIEAIGAVALWLAWFDELGPIGAIWPAVFHAISGFCNAGFSIFSENMMRFAGDAFSLAIIAGLVIVGGLGFLVLEELRRARKHRTSHRISLHTKLVVAATVTLLLSGWALFLIFEWNNVLAAHPAALRPLSAFFMSVTPRTAGFNNVDYELLTSASVFLTMMLMVIGGSPASTAGGIKTTTAAILIAIAASRLRGRIGTHAFRRSIPEGTIERAVGLVVLVLFIMTAAVLLLQITELAGVSHDLSRGLFLELAFEVVSAFNTVGLSMGVTDDLSTGGRLLLIVLMFIGRVGPFMLVASMAVAARLRVARFRYASEDVVVG